MPEGKSDGTSIFAADRCPNRDKPVADQNRAREVLRGFCFQTAPPVGETLAFENQWDCCGFVEVERKPPMRCSTLQIQQREINNIEDTEMTDLTQRGDWPPSTAYGRSKMSKSFVALLMVAAGCVSMAWRSASACTSEFTFPANGFMHHTAPPSSTTMTATGTEQNRARVRTSRKHHGTGLATDDVIVTSP